VKLSPALEKQVLKLAGATPGTHAKRGPKPASATPAALAAVPTTTLVTVVVTAFVPGLEVKSVANLREHHMVRANRAGRERKAVGGVLRWVLGDRFGPTIPRPLRVTLTREYTGRPFDDDNLSTSLKACRDAVSAWLEIDDGSDQIRFVTKQEKAAAAGVRVVIAGGEVTQ
jgi:hypothetical protein